MGSRGYWVRSSVTMPVVAAFPWEGWLSVQVCWVEVVSLCKGRCQAASSRLQRREPAPGLALDISSARAGRRPGPSWPLAHGPPSCDEGDGLSHQWNRQGSCLAGCREARLVFPIRPPGPQEVSPAQLTLVGSFATEGETLVIEKKIK